MADTPAMGRRDRPLEPDTDRDLIDTVPIVGRATTQLERSFGPSCLLSLVIVFLLAIVLKRFLRLSWLGLGILLVAVWFGVLLLLVRWRADRVAEDDDALGDE